MIELKNIYKSFDQVCVLDDINFKVKKNEIIAIEGSSGAGKTTLLKIIGKIERPDAGNIIFKEKNITKLDSNKLQRFRNNNIGFVFQFHHLMPEFTALENICMPALLSNRDKIETKFLSRFYVRR